MPETLARLIDRSGFLVWSATPQAGTQQLYDLHCRAEELALDEPELNKPRQVEESFLSIYDNRHISDQARTEFIDSLSEEERRVRVDGEFAITGLKIFEGYFFPSGVHGVDPFPIPHGWTRYAAVDPGAQVCAVLFGAVPPMTPDSTDLDPTLFGDFLYLYDELYIKRCDAVLFGRRMKDQVGDQSMYQFLIDHHGGRLTDVGSGKTPEQQYSDALKANGVKCLRTGHKFTWGSDDVAGRILKAKEWMHVRENGTAKIRVLKGRCPNLVKEMARYQWKKQGDVITDIPLKKNDHLCDTLGYLVMCNPRYVKAKPGDLPKSYAVRAVEAIKAREKSRRRAAGMTGVVLA